MENAGERLRCVPMVREERPFCDIYRADQHVAIIYKLIKTDKPNSAICKPNSSTCSSVSLSNRLAASTNSAAEMKGRRDARCLSRCSVHRHRIGTVLPPNRTTLESKISQNGSENAALQPKSPALR